MKIKFLIPLYIILILAGCCPSAATPTEVQPSPPEPADIIFFNGNLVTIDPSQPHAEAIAIRSGLILAVGSNEHVLAYHDPSSIMIDLDGQTLMPGFIDGHTHILAFPHRKDRTLAEAQETAIQYGFTSVTEMWADQNFIDQLLQAEQDGEMRLHVNVFPTYNAAQLDDQRNRIMTETWFPGNEPILDPERMVRIPGIKIYMDGDMWLYERGCWALSDPYEPGAPALARGVCGSDMGDLYWNQDELNLAVAQIQDGGFRVAFHAMGDLAIEYALNAIEYALDGQPNDDFRHQIEHNSLLRDDLLPRYAQLDVPASIRGYHEICDPEAGMIAWGADRHKWYANRYALAIQNDHAYLETDFGWTVDPGERYDQRTLDPIMHLYGLVTHLYVDADGTICEGADWVTAHQISVEKALQMMTIAPAYAVSMDEYIGSLETGKFADLVLLSENPITMDTTKLKDLSMGMTMIKGKVEYCADGYESFCLFEAP
jgi:predicted amidohydrolase YtcJ